LLELDSAKFLRANLVNFRLIPISTATKIPTMVPADVLAYLEKLPSSAWPYDLVVAVEENGIIGRGDEAQIKRNREESVRPPEKAGVKVELWPSA
jgi:hypothetical protein